MLAEMRVLAAAPGGGGSSPVSGDAPAVQLSSLEDAPEQDDLGNDGSQEPELHDEATAEQSMGKRASQGAKKRQRK